MDDDLKKDPLMGDSSELDAEVADFGKDVSDNFDEVKSESDPVVDEDAGKVVDMSTTEPGIESQRKWNPKKSRCLKLALQWMRCLRKRMGPHVAMQKK